MCKAGSSELLCVGCKSEFSRTGLASLKHCLSRWQLPPQILTHTLFPKRSAKKTHFMDWVRFECWQTNKSGQERVPAHACTRLTWRGCSSLPRHHFFPSRSTRLCRNYSFPVTSASSSEEMWEKKRVKEKPACCEFQKTLPHLISTSCHKAENRLWVTGSCTYVIHSPVIVQLNILSWYSKWILMCFQDHNKTFNMWKT